MDARFEHPTYLLRRKVLKLAGGAFRLFDPAGNLVLYADQKAFKLREDIRLYASEQKQEELLTISARKIVDISATYDVQDAKTGEVAGALRRRGLRSMVRDEWDVLGAGDTELGKVEEDSLGAALTRRFLVGGLWPQVFGVTIDGQPAATFTQRFNPFVPQIELDFTPDTAGRLDRRVGIAAAVLLSAIEGRQGN